MRKRILFSLVLIPFLLTVSDAADDSSVDPSEHTSPEHTMIFSSEDSGASSYLGVDIADVTGERVSQLKLKEEKGVEITMVDQDAPAGKAGIKEHDVILTMNGTAVDSAAQLRRMIHETPPGRVVTLGLSRDGQPMTVKVQLGDKGKEYAFSAPKAKEYHFEVPPIPPMPEMPEIDIPAFNMVVVTSSPRSGLTVENITPQLGEFFGVKNGNGVLVRAVAKGSRAEKAGFRAGDVIVKINDQTIHDTSDFTHAVRSRDGDSVNVGVVRDKKEQTIALPMPERKDSGELLDEESMEYPLLGDASPVELREVQEEVQREVQHGVQQEIARLQPEIKLATDDVRKNAEEVRQSACQHSRQALREAEEQRREARQQADEQRREAEEQRREARQQAEQQRREAEGQRREAEQARREALREAEEQQKEMRREAEEQRREARESMEEQQREYRHQEQELRQQMRQMEKQLQKNYLDI